VGRQSPGGIVGRQSPGGLRVKKLIPKLPSSWGNHLERQHAPGSQGHSVYATQNCHASKRILVSRPSVVLEAEVRWGQSQVDEIRYLGTVTNGVIRGRRTERASGTSASLLIGVCPQVRTTRACDREPLRRRWGSFAKQVCPSTATLAATAFIVVENPGLNRDKLGWGRVCSWRK